MALGFGDVRYGADLVKYAVHLRKRPRTELNHEVKGPAECCDFEHTRHFAQSQVDSTPIIDLGAHQCERAHLGSLHKSDIIVWFARTNGELMRRLVDRFSAVA